MICLGSPMDKTVDSGSTDTGSIPVRDAKCLNTSTHADTGVCFFSAISCEEIRQKIMGHTGMDMTKRYVALSDTDIKAGHNSFTPIKSVLPLLDWKNHQKHCLLFV